MNPTNQSHTNPPINEHPDDPDHGFNEREENYLHVIVKRLREAHNQTLAIQLAARSQVAAAQENERALWDASAFYLTEAALWHQKRTGESQLHVPDGILNIIEETGYPQIADPTSLKNWVQTLLNALLPLAAVTSQILAAHQDPEKEKAPSLATAHSENKSSANSLASDSSANSLFDPYWPWEEDDIEHSFMGARRRNISPLESAVATSHTATGILPAGCQPGETRTVVRLG